MIAMIALAAGIVGPAPAAIPAPAPAVAPAPANVVPASGERVTTLTVYGEDRCPKGGENEIVVCARRPENERYRIPPNLRHKKPLPAEGSWANNAALLDEVGRQQMVPGSCSVNGINGQTGCTRQMIHQWYQERQQQKREDADREAGMAEADIPTPP